MRIRRPKVKIVNFVIIVLFTSLCLWIAFDPCPILSNSKANRPGYLDQVWPPENTNIPVGCYYRRSLKSYMFLSPSRIADPPKNLRPDGGVAVTIFPDTLIDEQVRKNPSFPSRVSLYINGRRVSQTELDRGTTVFSEIDDMSYMPQWYYFSGYPILFPGEHIARFVIVKIDGTRLEYEWHFTITWW